MLEPEHYEVRAREAADIPEIAQTYASLAIAAAIDRQTRALIRIHNSQPADGGTYISEGDF
jgi:hypothetical protein